MSDPQVTPQPTPSVSIAGVPVLTPEGQRKAEDMAIEFLGQSVLRDNIVNYDMANKFFINSMYTAEKMGNTVFNAVKDRIAPFPQSTMVLNQSFTPPAQAPQAAPVQVSPLPVSTGNSAAPAPASGGFLKQAAIYGTIAAASAGLGVGAPIIANYLTTPKPAVAPVEPGPAQDHPESSLDLEVR
jgi:hypothetical protein